MKDFSLGSSQENKPCLEEAPSGSVVSEIVSPSETQSLECSEQDMEERVNLLKWSYFDKDDWPLLSRNLLNKSMFQ